MMSGTAEEREQTGEVEIGKDGEGVDVEKVEEGVDVEKVEEGVDVEKVGEGVDVEKVGEGVDVEEVEKEVEVEDVEEEVDQEQNVVQATLEEEKETKEEVKTEQSINGVEQKPSEKQETGVEKNEIKAEVIESMKQGEAKQNGDVVAVKNGKNAKSNLSGKRVVVKETGESVKAKQNEKKGKDKKSVKPLGVQASEKILEEDTSKKSNAPKPSEKPATVKTNNKTTLAKSSNPVIAATSSNQHHGEVLTEPSKMEADERDEELYNSKSFKSVGSKEVKHGEAAKFSKAFDKTKGDKLKEKSKHKTSTMLKKMKPKVKAHSKHKVNTSLFEVAEDDKSTRKSIVQSTLMEYETRMRLLKALHDLEAFVHEYSVDDIDDSKFEKLEILTKELKENSGELLNYCDDSRNKLSVIRQPIEKLSAAIAAKLTMKVEENAEQCLLNVKYKKLNQQMATLNDDLLKASVITAETELAALNSQKACEDSMAMAETLKAEAEERKRQALEQARLLELEKEAMQQLLEEQNRLRLEEEAREKALALMRLEECYNWPLFPLNIESKADFDGGVGCLIRADPAILLDGRLECIPLDLMKVFYQFEDDEELVSHVMNITIPGVVCEDGALTIRPEMCISIPHCMPKSHATNRELVVKLRVHKKTEWLELSASDASLDAFKDIKFAQVQTRYFGTFMVVSRNKKTIVRIKRTGGRVKSKIDPKLTFQVASDSFLKPEKIVMQLQPIDNLIMKYLKKTMILANNLLSASNIIKLSWVNKSFETPIKMTIPIPPNPISLKKINTNKPMKEEMPKSTPPVATQSPTVEQPAVEEISTPRFVAAFEDSNFELEEEEEEKSDKDAGIKTQPILWYMGIYNNETEDESDNLYVVRKKKDKWVVEEVNLNRTALDCVTITLKEPLDTFIVLRTAVSIKTKGAETIATALDNMMSRKIVCFAVSQNRDITSEFIASVLPIQKMDRYIATMDDKYEVITNKEQHFMLKEGEKVTITFRGNLKSIIRNENLSARWLQACLSALYAEYTLL